LFIEHNDGIRVEFAKEKHFKELKDVFTTVWLKDNNLYRTLQVPPHEFHQYVDIVFDRCRAVPWSASVGIDLTLPSRSEDYRGQIVSFSFCQDYLNDMVPAERFSLLSDRMKVIMEFNENALEGIRANPLFTPLLRVPRAVLYGLHTGTIPSHVGRETAAGTISTRVGSLQFLHCMRMGYCAFIGVCTHFETARRAYLRMCESKDTVIFSSLPFATWQPSSTAAIKYCQQYCGGEPPFKSITQLPDAVGMITAAPTLRARL
tara:strand:- start:418 stop:1200 length:783 start_codon:yes stop_codon:yes gene_type:complete